MAAAPTPIPAVVLHNVVATATPVDEVVKENSPAKPAVRSPRKKISTRGEKILPMLPSDLGGILGEDDTETAMHPILAPILQWELTEGPATLGPGDEDEVEELQAVEENIDSDEAKEEVETETQAVRSRPATTVAEGAADAPALQDIPPTTTEPAGSGLPAPQIVKAGSKRRRMEDEDAEPYKNSRARTSSAQDPLPGEAGTVDQRSPEADPSCDSDAVEEGLPVRAKQARMEFAGLEKPEEGPPTLLEQLVAMKKKVEARIEEARRRYAEEDRMHLARLEEHDRGHNEMLSRSRIALLEGTRASMTVGDGGRDTDDADGETSKATEPGESSETASA